MGKRMPGRLSFVKIFSACGSIIYRRKRRKTDELDIGWGCGVGHSGLRRCGMAKGSDSRGTRLFADGTGAARNESSKPFYRKIFKGDNPV